VSGSETFLLVAGWVVTALALGAGVVLWVLTVRRLAAGLPLPSGEREKAPAVPTRAHLGSVFFSLGAALLLLAVAIPLFIMSKGTRDYSVTLALFAGVLFCVGLGHGWIVQRRTGKAWPLHVAYWPFLIYSMFAAPIANPFWLWFSLWFWWVALWMFGVPAALVTRKLHRRPRWAFGVSTATMLLLMLLFGRTTIAAGWLVSAAGTENPNETPKAPPAPAVSECALREAVIILRRARVPIKPYALKNKFGPWAVPALIALLGDADANVRANAVWALGDIGDVRAVEPLIAALRDADVRWCAARALGELGDNRAVEPLIPLLGDADANVRVYAAGALGEINKDPRAFAVLITALGDTGAQVRWSAAGALGKLGDIRAVGPLVVLLGDADISVRGSAARALGCLGDIRAVEPLIPLLGDADANVRWSAAAALWKINKDPRAFPVLIAALEDANLYARRGAAQALRDITGQDFGEDAEAWQKWWDANRERLLKETPPPEEGAP